MENWKDIQGFEGIYQVSDTGSVKSLERVNQRGVPLPEKIMKMRSDKDGYLAVSLFNGEKYVGCRVHRLVAVHFINNPSDLPEVNHEDGDKTNNQVNNLTWCDSKGNKKHAFATGLRGGGTRIWNAKLTDEKVREMRDLYDTGQWTHLQLANKYGVSKCVAGKVIRRQVWKHVD